MDTWSQGVSLLGRYNYLGTGCWLLWQGKSAAILELPPYSRSDDPPVIMAWKMARELGLTVRYLLCSHDHMDHFSRRTAAEFLNAFPSSRLVLHEWFRPAIPGWTRVSFFQHTRKLSLNGEPLYLIHAPKHSWTDTMVVFRGVIFTGDWELNTIRSVHDRKGRMSVPRSWKMKSIRKLAAFPQRHNYHIHKVFSVHANDRRESVNFPELMLDTTVNRRLW